MAKKILVIEDEKTLRFLVTKILTEEGFEVDEAIDGEQGLEKAKQNKPDLILLDLRLPGINGFDVLTEIKKDVQLESTEVIILSNLGQKEEIEKGMNLGATDYMIKAHFTLDEIVTRVKRILKV
jgi:DNA-binding response OmpR family regulator